VLGVSVEIELKMDWQGEKNLIFSNLALNRSMKFIQCYHCVNTLFNTV